MSVFSGERLMQTCRYTVAGSGLAGSLMAILLARQGHRVRVLEGRADPRGGPPGGGRSINLALSARGLHALDQVGLKKTVLGQAVGMRGRMMHSPTGSLTFQPYGIHHQDRIHSVSRSALNLALIEAAGREPGVTQSFQHRCLDVDLGTAAVMVEDEATGEMKRVEADALVGADGAFSSVRQRMQRQPRFDYSQSYLTHGYKELTIPARPDGSFAMEAEALHIWPRGGKMMIALPNQDGTFTCTLFWPFDGPEGFTALSGPAEVESHFQRHMPDVLPLMPDLAQQYLQGRTSALVTVRCGPWHVGDRVVLVGDACHAVVPFYGQGANAAFEDCVLLHEALQQHAGDRQRAFLAYDSHRRPQANALADLALANFIEMRDATGSRLFLAGKKLERVCHRLAPKRFVPLYTMVSFSRMPYAEAVARARRQWRWVALIAACIGLAVAGALALVLAMLVFQG